MEKHCSATFDHLEAAVSTLQAEIYRDYRVWAWGGPGQKQSSGGEGGGECGRARGLDYGEQTEPVPISAVLDFTSE